jgi:hypothetical protein
VAAALAKRWWMLQLVAVVTVKVRHLDELVRDYGDKNASGNYYADKGNFA